MIRLYTIDGLTSNVFESFLFDSDRVTYNIHGNIIIDGDTDVVYDKNRIEIVNVDRIRFEDLVGNLLGRTLYSVQGTLDYNWEDNCIVMQPGGDINDSADRLTFNFQVPHGAKKDSEMKLHLHWEQPNSTVRQWKIEYRIQQNGKSKTTEWQQAAATTSDNVFIYESGTLNQITRLVTVDLTGVDISATVQFRLCRSDNNAGNINITFVDAHVQLDDYGSISEYSKI